jgi:hypothetical protein
LIFFPRERGREGFEEGGVLVEELDEVLEVTDP